MERQPLAGIPLPGCLRVLLAPSGRAWDVQPQAWDSGTLQGATLSPPVSSLAAACSHHWSVLRRGDPAGTDSRHLQNNKQLAFGSCSAGAPVAATFHVHHGVWFLISKGVYIMFLDKHKLPRQKHRHVRASRPARRSCRAPPLQLSSSTVFFLPSSLLAKVLNIEDLQREKGERRGEERSWADEGPGTAGRCACEEERAARLLLCRLHAAAPVRSASILLGSCFPQAHASHSAIGHPT